MSRETPHSAAQPLDSAIIREECRRRGWNQETLARASGLSRPTVSVAYRGGNVSTRTAQRIWQAFDRNQPEAWTALLKKVG